MYDNLNTSLSAFRHVCDTHGTADTIYCYRVEKTNKCWLTLFYHFVHLMDLFHTLVHGHLTGPCHINTCVLNLATHAAHYGCQGSSTSFRQTKRVQVPNISQFWTIPLHVGGCWLHWRLAWHWAVDGPSMV